MKLKSILHLFWTSSAWWKVFFRVEKDPETDWCNKCDAAAFCNGKINRVCPCEERENYLAFKSKRARELASDFYLTDYCTFDEAKQVWKLKRDETEARS